MRQVILFIFLILADNTFSQSNWAHINTDFLNGKIIRSISFYDHSTGYLVGSEGVFAKTSNGGLNWQLIPNSISNDFNSISMSHSYIYIASNSGWTYKTSNFGNSWDSLKLNTTGDLKLISFQSVDSGIVIAGNSNPINSFFTSNGGINWITNSIANEDYIGSNSSHTNKYFVVSGRANGPFQYIYSIRESHDVGFNWNILVSGNHADYVDACLNENNGLLSRRMEIKSTTNGGLTWNGSMFLYRDAKVELVTENIGYAIPTVGLDSIIKGVKTTNGGLSWVYFNTGLNTINDFYFIDPNTGFIYNDDTLLMTTNGGGIPTSVNELNSNLPKISSLHQNYPNPFNPSTKIKFDIPKGSLVKLKIYDMLGREVATLVNEKLNPGTYEYEWNGINLPSGVYFYKLESENFIETKRMVLVK